jgi:23S rRNA pseudouridine2457 synthase
MSRILLFNKPFGVLSQCTGSASEQTLAAFIMQPGFYAAGRLDKDSEGLLLLTDDGKLQHRIADPQHKLGKTYLAQIEGEVDEFALNQLRRGVKLNDGPTKPAQARAVPDPGFWERDPPIRKRLSIPTSWIELVLVEGRNRQVRRMTAAVGFPTLRLVRTRIGDWSLEDLQPGESRLINV